MHFALLPGIEPSINANIARPANDRLAPGDQVTHAAMHAALHEQRNGCRLGKDAFPTVRRPRLFAAWPDLGLLLAMAPDEPLYKAVVDTAHLWNQYQTYQVGPRHQCRAIAAAFREHCAPGLPSHCLLFLEEDANRLLQDIWPFSMAVFSNDIVQSLNRFLKQGFDEHSARGSGK